MNAGVVLASTDVLQNQYMEQWKSFMGRSVSKEEVENKWIPKYCEEDRPVSMTEHFLKGVKASTYSVLAKSEGLTVGMGRIVGDGGIIFLLVDVIVIPEFQGKGIGKKIMNRLMHWIKTNGAKGSLIWLFAAEGREGFYERFGFEKRSAIGKGAGMQ